jgi:hypothetical protein
MSISKPTSWHCSIALSTEASSDAIKCIISGFSVTQGAMQRKSFRTAKFYVEVRWGQSNAQRVKWKKADGSTPGKEKGEIHPFCVQLDGQFAFLENRIRAAGASCSALSGIRLTYVF